MSALAEPAAARPSDSAAPAAAASTDAAPVVLLGLAQAPWRKWVQSVLDAASADVRVGDDDSATAIDRWVEEHPRARFIAFIHHPTSALANALSAGWQAQDALSHWRVGARALLRHAHRRPAAWMFVDADEAAAAPQALMKALARWDPRLAWSTDLTWSRTASDEVCLALSSAVVGADADAGALFTELHASCAELDGSAPRDAGAALDIDAAIAQHRALQAERQTLESQVCGAREEIDAQQHRAFLIERQLAATQASAETAAARLSELEGDLARTGHALSAQGAESTRWRQAHAALRIEFEALAQARDEHLEETKAAAERLAAALAEGTALRTLVQRQQDELAQAAQQRGSLQTQLAGLADEREHARHENELQLLQLHQAQESIEATHALLQEAESNLASPHGGPGALVRLGSAEVSALHDAPPHRQVDFALTHVEVDGRSLPELNVRLVDHHSRPGLALFCGAEQPTPLAAWRPNGTEEGRPYLLLVPEDAPSRHMLDTLGQSDWILVRAVADLTLRLAASPRYRLPARWRGVAARLCMQLADLPARLRYDAIEVGARAPQASELRLTLVNAGFGSRRLGDIILRWQASNGELRWIAPPETHELPFARWPAGLDGLPRPEVVLPVARSLSWRDRRRAWSGMPDGERELLLGLLDALPAATATLSDNAVPPGSTRQHLHDAALRMRQQARQALMLGRVHAAFGRLMRPSRTAV